MVFWWGCQVRIVCRRGGGSPPRGALVGVVKVLGSLPSTLTAYL